MSRLAGVSAARARRRNPERSRGTDSPRFSKPLRYRFRTHLQNLVRETTPAQRAGDPERSLELLRRKAAVFRTAVAACFTTRAMLVCRPGVEPGCFSHGALDAACIPIPASAQIWSARRDSNPQGFHPLRSERSAYAGSATRGKLGGRPQKGTARQSFPGRFAGGAVSVSLPSSIWWVEQDLNLQARPEQPGYSRLVSPITTSTQKLVGRANPSASECAGDPENTIRTPMPKQRFLRAPCIPIPPSAQKKGRPTRVSRAACIFCPWLPLAHTSTKAQR